MEHLTGFSTEHNEKIKQTEKTRTLSCVFFTIYNPRYVLGGS